LESLNDEICGKIVYWFYRETSQVNMPYTYAESIFTEYWYSFYDGVQWQILANTMMNLRFPSPERLLSFSRWIVFRGVSYRPIPITLNQEELAISASKK
jgi:hypothetical protein